MLLILASFLVFNLPSAAPPTDSVPLFEAHRSLEGGDTLGAIDILDEWSRDHEVGQELNDLMGRLHLPDEPIDTAYVAHGSKPVQVPNRRWRLRVDGGSLVADPWYWDLGTTLATQIATLKVGGSPAVLEGGMVSVVWSTKTDPPLWAVEPLLSLSVQAGRWDVRVQGWSGVFDEEFDAGLMATGSIAKRDSAKANRRWGGTIRWSLASTSLVGVFGQWDEAIGDWTWEARSDLRLRYDPVQSATSNIGDSLIVRAARIQSITRAVVLRHFGNWGFGPALELDLRSSLASDRWRDTGVAYRKQVRKDVSFSVGAVVRRSTQNGRWLELRLGWTGAEMDSRIDPTFSDRNTGATLSFATGLSF